MSKRAKLSIALGFAVVVVVGGIVWWLSRPDGPQAFCEEAENGLERINNVEGPGYDDGLDSLQALRRAAERKEPADTNFVALVDRLSPLLQQASDAYDSGGYEAVDALPSDTLTEFDQLTEELDAALEARCPAVYGTTPPSPDSRPPQPTMVEVTTATTD